MKKKVVPPPKNKVQEPKTKDYSDQPRFNPKQGMYKKTRSSVGSSQDKTKDLFLRKVVTKSVLKREAPPARIQPRKPVVRSTKK